VWTPGEYLVMDWAEAASELFLFCAVLAYSRWRLVQRSIGSAWFPAAASPTTETQQ
jgi:hypothetical protein